MKNSVALRLVAAAALAGAAPASAQEVNLYSSRHYDTDRTLYETFTKETGIRVRLIEGDADQLIERIRSEGANSPADVLITVDAARLARAKAAGVNVRASPSPATCLAAKGIAPSEMKHNPSTPAALPAWRSLWANLRRASTVAMAMPIGGTMPPAMVAAIGA